MQAQAISVPAALVAAGCGVLAVFSAAQTPTQKTGAKPTAAKTTVIASKSTKTSTKTSTKSSTAAKSAAASSKGAASEKSPAKSTGAKSVTAATNSAKATAYHPPATTYHPPASTYQPPSARSTAAKSTVRSGTRTVASKGTGSKSGSTPGSRSGSTTAKQAASSYRAPQQQPTVDRYREIQQALADRGYFAGPVDGNWGASSVDALKRFQHDQNLTEDGKVGSLSLIALGLGPKRDPAPAGKPAPTPDAGSEGHAPADSATPSTPTPSTPIPEAAPQ